MKQTVVSTFDQHHAPYLITSLQRKCLFRNNTKINQNYGSLKAKMNKKWKKSEPAMQWFRTSFPKLTNKATKTGLQDLYQQKNRKQRKRTETDSLKIARICLVCGRCRRALSPPPTIDMGQGSFPDEQHLREGRRTEEKKRSEHITL